MRETETLEQIAERLADLVNGDPVLEAEVLAALREAEARGEQRAAALGGALLDSAKERAEKAENDRLLDLIPAANSEGQGDGRK